MAPKRRSMDGITEPKSKKAKLMANQIHQARKLIKCNHGQEMESERAKIIAGIFHEASGADYTGLAHVILSRVGTDSLVIEQISKNKTIHEVSQTGNIDLLKELLSLGVEIDCLNDDGKSPLHIACENRSTKIVEELLKSGANPNLRSTTNDKSPLHHIFEDDDDEMDEITKRIGTIPFIKCLLKYSADINALDKRGRSTLYLASFYEDFTAVRLLLKNGAKPDCGKESISPLYDASEYNNIAIVEELLNHGADVNPKDGQDIPLYIASWEGHSDLVSKLIAHGADVNIQNSFGNTPLHASCQKGHLEIVKKLLIHGANANLQIENQKLPIVVATNGGHLAIVKELLKYGANIDVPS